MFLHPTVLGYLNKWFLKTLEISIQWISRHMFHIFKITQSLNLHGRSGLCIHKYVLNKLAHPLIYSLAQGKTPVMRCVWSKGWVLNLELEIIAICAVLVLIFWCLLKIHLTFPHFILCNCKMRTMPSWRKISKVMGDAQLRHILFCLMNLNFLP